MCTIITGLAFLSFHHLDRFHQRANMDEDVAVSEQWPFELIQETVDNLRDDIPTLRNICLVSKSWRSASIPHLFAEINLTKESDFRCWESIRERNPEIVARPLRKVILYIPEDSTSDSGAAIMASVPIISPFPVQTFELAWVSYKAGFVFDDNMHRYMSNLLGIRKLTVIGPTVILQSDLFQLMRGCGSKLEDVSLSEMVKIRAQFANSMEIFNLSRLTTLELSDIPVDWLALALPHLKILSLTSLTATDSAEYPWYWRDFGKMVVLTSPSLMYLHLTSRPTYGLISTVPLPLLQSSPRNSATIAPNPRSHSFSRILDFGVP
ncbi:hypothetical protein C8J56DRAFT_409338 [Mycena floridula]|nr:hypothetical protein C8J56DRAFT_409338 [Mycena floridula]